MEYPDIILGSMIKTKDLLSRKVQVLQSDQLTLLKQARDNIVEALKTWNPDPSKLSPQEMKTLANAQHQLAKLEEMIERQERFKRWGV